MNILFVASEATPFIKTGGLADVAGSLPYALQAEGHNVTVVIPFYSKISQELKDKMTKIAEFYIDMQWRRQYAGVLEYKEEGLTYLFIDNKFYFDRHEIYGLGDDGERFVFFNKAVVQMIRELDMKVDIVHANDWHCGLVPLYIKDFGKGDNFYNSIKSVYTIHNLKYQGVFPASLLALTGLSIDYFNEGLNDMIIAWKNADEKAMKSFITFEDENPLNELLLGKRDKEMARKIDLLLQ